MKKTKHIYLDHSATTPVDPAVLKAMLPYFGRGFGNPSSLHSFGQAALAGVDQAREQTAAFLGCSPDEIVFTSGATEADNLAIGGLIKALEEKYGGPLHIVTSAVEHDAVLEPCRELAKAGVKVTYVGVGQNGQVDPAEVEKAIKAETALVSIMYVNSEVGAIQPIRAIGKLVRKLNEKRLREWEKRRAADRGERPRPVYFHTDAVQAVNFLNCDVVWNYIDLLSLSGHKIYGPKGVGALYVRTGVPLKALTRGGHHERDRRSGTLNTAGIAGLGEALSRIGAGKKGALSPAQIKNNKRIAKLRDKLADGVFKSVPGAVLNTDRAFSAPAHAHFTFPGAEGESVLISLDLKGIAVSTGSACASGSLKASHVLLAMGIKEEIAHNSIRFTLGKNTTEKEIRTVLKELPPIVERLRQMNPIYMKMKPN